MEEIIIVNKKCFITITPMVGGRVFRIMDLDKAIQEAEFGAASLARVKLVMPNEKIRKWISSEQVDIPFRTKQEAEEIVAVVSRLKRDYFFVRRELPALLLIKMLLRKIFRRAKSAATYFIGVVVFTIGMLIFPFYVVLSREYWRMYPIKN